jgi:hypothetical protein
MTAKQESGDRRAGDRNAGAEQLEKYSWDRTAGIRQSGKTAETSLSGRTAKTSCWDRKARTRQSGQHSTEMHERRGRPQLHRKQNSS